MIQQKIKALFQFIEYLHSNIENFNQYNGLIKELETLKDEKNNLKPYQNYKDKLQYNKVQAELESKLKTLQDNTANLIKAKAKELKVCIFENEPNYNFNGVETEISQLKKNFTDKELPEIFKHKSQYLEYRSNTHSTFLSLQFFFDELDELAKSLFDYFKDTDQNEFEEFETKAVQASSIVEAAQRFNKQGQTKFIVPNFWGKTQNKIQEQLTDFNFFQIEVIADLEFEGKIYKDEKQRNNDSILTPENWEEHKETFFTQRIETYKDGYTLAEKVKLELSELEKLPINKTDYKILKDRYRAYLEQKQSLPPQQTEKPKPEQETPKTFEELFYNPAHAEPCLKILNELQPPVIDAINNYIGKAKGIFPLWVKVLKNHEPKPLIKHFKDVIYKDLLNEKVKGLNLSKDASEFRKQYKRIEKEKVELDIKAILSQYSQSGKLGK